METFCALLAILRVTGHLCGEFTGPRWIPAQRPVTRSFDLFFDPHLNKRMSKQSYKADDLRRYRIHYDVIVMSGHIDKWFCPIQPIHANIYIYTYTFCDFME